jgi:hypothetical protein
MNIIGVIAKLKPFHENVENLLSELGIPFLVGSVVVFLFIYLGVKFESYLKTTDGICPKCKNTNARIELSSTYEGTHSTPKTIKHQDPTYDTKHNITGYQYRSETVYTTHDVYSTHCKCKFCNHEWVE